ncbi:hypothetical protein HELRODRAFT_195076, partial [Helobdella robusta]|uniref:Ig-like domain-containing protein n=1 Tax=Helobdella robusta TaxID=6412 RepID=T1FWQ5_HELRO
MFVQPALTQHRGMRLLHYTTQRLTSHYLPSPSDNGKFLKCEVSVPGFDTTRILAKMRVLYGAMISCDDVSAHVGERNVNIRCDVRCNPPYTLLYWVLNGNGSAVVEGQENEDYKSIVMTQSPDLVEAILVVNHVTPLTSSHYVIIVTNDVAVRARDVFLRIDATPNLSAGADSIVRKSPKTVPTTYRKPEHNSKRMSFYFVRNHGNSDVIVAGSTKNSKIISMVYIIVTLLVGSQYDVIVHLLVNQWGTFNSNNNYM